jgi:hypothetical protein
MRSILVFATASLVIHSAFSQTSGPPDKPLTVRGQALVDAMDRAAAPYITKARATYPAAKKRYLAGLPPNHIFAVSVRLYQTDKKSREKRHETVLVVVDAIKGGSIEGRINGNLVLLTNYRPGERIRIPESELMNWLILRPDGTEEGNYVGKFLEHWKPPKA